MRVGSLFSGIGGLDLGLERAGMTVVWQSEIDEYASRVLAKHWPEVPNLGDITTIDWSGVEDVDVICGGYPCQPFSLAGQRGGDNDARHLWPHVAVAIRELRPRYAVLENVPGHLSLGFGEVLGDLAELGYNTDWDCIPAAAVGAPHLRYRVFIVAHANQLQHESRPPQVGRSSTPHLPANANSYDVREQPVGVGRSSGSTVALLNGRERGLADPNEPGPPRGTGETGRRPGTTRRMEPQRLGRGSTGIGESARGHWTSEPDVGRVAHGVPSRVDRLRTLGNAVVPQVAEYVGRRLMAATSPAPVAGTAAAG